MDKVLRLGSSRDGDVFVHVQYTNKRLSLTGVVGPKANGSARGSCGQIDIPPITAHALGWDAASVARLAETWARWHLNDRRAGCEHQRVSGASSVPLEIITYRLTGEALRERRSIKDRTDRELREHGHATMDPTERALLALPYTTTHAPDADSADSGQYEVKKRETKTAGWVYASEHPQGVLMKPCEVCGYKYGSAWLHEDVPTDVLAWLDALPTTDKVPAWV